MERTRPQQKAVILFVDEINCVKRGRCSPDDAAIFAVARPSANQAVPKVLVIDGGEATRWSTTRV